MLTRNEFAEMTHALMHAYLDAGVSANAHNFLSWGRVLADVPAEEIMRAIAEHRAECPQRLPNVDDIRERAIGDTRDPIEKLQDLVVEQAARIDLLERKLGVAAKAAPIKPNLSARQKRKPVAAVAKPVQLSLLPESEKAEEDNG